ncbi:hypothetical protein ACHAWF_004831 [Thalassiosira exigua]
MASGPRRRFAAGGGTSGKASGGGGGGGGGETPFDRAVKSRQRARSAASCRAYYDRHLRSLEGSGEASSVRRPPRRGVVPKPTPPYDYFHREVARRLVERLDDINLRGGREGGFPLALELGASAEFVCEALLEGCEDDLLLDSDGEGDARSAAGGRGGVRKLVQMDACSEMLRRDDAFDGRSGGSVVERYKLHSDPEGHPLPFPDGTFDLVVSSMAFHRVNDLPRLLSEAERVLKPDGCLLFALPGGNTLPELRSSLVLAELERTGGASVHVGPYVDPSDVGGLLTDAGFRLPTIDVDDVRVGYPDALVLMEHLARMGEGNACADRRARVGTGTFVGAACLYRELYPAEEEGDGEEGVVASAQVIYGIAWKEHASQQRPKERGSATSKLTDISVTQTSAGESPT